MRAAIAIESWKLAIFNRHLTQAGYTYEIDAGPTEDSIFLTVETENRRALTGVVQAANNEAACVGTLQ